MKQPSKVPAPNEPELPLGTTRTKSPAMVKVRSTRGIFIDNPKKGTFGEPDTVKIPRGTIKEVMPDEAIKLVQSGFHEMVPDDE